MVKLPQISSVCWERAHAEMEKEETGVPVLEELLAENGELFRPFLETTLGTCGHYGRGALTMWLALRYQIEENQIKDLEALIRKE